MDQIDQSWNVKVISQIANQVVPDFIMSGRGSLLKADIHILWTQWFIESVCDPEKFIEANQTEYAYIVQSVKNSISTIFTDITDPERDELIKYVARLVDRQIGIRHPRKRGYISSDIKKLLWDISGTEPRCWICGYRFTEWAKNKFLGFSNDKEPTLPQFVDYMTLHGLKMRDICVEIDHALPFSKGGEDNEENFRLSCGWCNAYKSNRIALYDVTVKPRIFKHPKLGKQSLPHPFWIIRLLSVRKCCEYEGDCNSRVDNAQLTVMPKHLDGAMNPVNLRVICSEHHPLGSDRLVHRSIAEQIRWEKKS